jgi:hypothetical protein
MKEKTINICPSWRGIANTCILLLEVGNEDARQTAKAEIRKMGDILDGEFKQGALDEEKDSHQPTQDSA